MDFWRMAVYNDSSLIEQPIYGSSRLGQYLGYTTIGQRTLGNKNYELTNHLGNVLTVVTDNISMSTIDAITATVASASDYYPFGLQMPGRTVSDTVGYRYGFNGKERDPDSEWGQTSYDYGFRIYNPEIGKFLSVDPLTKDYPWYTPYQFAGNMPIWAIDLDGLEELPANTIVEYAAQRPELELFNDVVYYHEFKEKVKKAVMNEYFIEKDKTTGEYQFNKFAAFESITSENLTDEETYSKYKKLDLAAYAALQNYDISLFGGYIYKKQMLALDLKLKNDKQNRLILEQRRKELQKITIGDVVDLSLSGGGIIVSGLSIFGGPVTGWGVLGFGMSVDNFQASLIKILDKSNMKYDPNKSYTIGGTIENSLTGTSYIYEVVGIVNSSKNVVTGSIYFYSSSNKILDGSQLIFEGSNALNGTINYVKEEENK